MQDKIDYAVRQAAGARKRADVCSDKAMQEEWLTVARMWEELILAYRGLDGGQE
jgi:hypothetical protein